MFSGVEGNRREDSIILFLGDDIHGHKVGRVSFDIDFFSEIDVGEDVGSGEGSFAFLEGPLIFDGLDESLVVLCQSSDKARKTKEPLDELTIRVAKTQEGTNVASWFRYGLGNNGFHFSSIYANAVGVMINPRYSTWLTRNSHFCGLTSSSTSESCFNTHLTCWTCFSSH